MPEPGEAFIWKLDLAAAGDEATREASIREALSPDECRRADAFRFARDRNRFVATRSALRALLADVTGQDAARVSFRYGAAGRPALEDAPHIEFSVSHSGDMALIAIALKESPCFELGIDVEAVRAVADAVAIAERYFTKAEASSLARVPPEHRARAFLRIWVTKEACVKASGRGLAALADLNDRMASARPLPWHVTEIDAGAGYVAAMAYASERLTLSFWDDPRAALEASRPMARTI